ncbi:MAG TPA: 2-C-methyl-D-erythritol 4-phosphate cytidylyltransferase, partial [Acidimicrobiales bacterium]|nr:2-C-methyl-D-erythritol 4-phosphate cytidylyltransferase [Acidimicrobiales bacterium]
PAPGADVTVPGGATRSDSVRAGLSAVPEDVAVVVVHDAARPLASPALFRAVVEAVAAGADAAVPGVRVPDTVKRVGGDGVVEETLDRDPLVLVQTPQAFAGAALRRAHRSGTHATDDAALVEADGGRVVVVPGEPDNLKITRADDLVRAAALIGRG